MEVKTTYFTDKWFKYGRNLCIAIIKLHKFKEKNKLEEIVNLSLSLWYDNDSTLFHYWENESQLG